MFRTSTKLYFLAFVMCASIAGIGFYGIRQLEMMNNNLKSIYQDRLFPVEQLTAIRYDYGFGIFSTLQRLQDGTITVSEAQNKIVKSQKDIQINWLAYKKTYLTEEEKRIVREAEVLKIKADNSINKICEDLRRGINISVNETYIDNIPPVIFKFNELVQLQLRVSGEINSDNQKLYSSTSREFYFIIISSVIIAVLFSFYIVEDTNLLIKKLRLTTRKMLESEEKTRAYIEYAGDGIIMFSDDLELVNYNSTISKMLGYKRHEIENFRFADFFFDEDITQNPLKLKLVRERNGLLTERNLKRSDGTAIETEINTKPLLGGGYIAVVRDITERKRVERELIENNLELKKANLELDSFVYHTSHDLRAPLTSLMGLMKITQMELLPEQQETSKKIAMMERMVNKLDDFIGDILDYSKNNRTDVVESNIDFNEIISGITERLHFMEGAETIKISTDIQQKVAYVSDKIRLEIILGNLISNAIKYQDKTKEHGYINIKIHSDDEKAVIIIEDNGIGIADENKEKIFEIFYRASKISTGSGLGLYIVKEAIAKLNGNLKVESELKKGTKFTVTIPNLIKHNSHEN